MFTSLDLTPRVNPITAISMETIRKRQKFLDGPQMRNNVPQEFAARLRIPADPVSNSNCVVCGLPAGWGEFLLAVWNPDVLHLHGVIEEPPAFALFQVEPVDGAALVGEHLLQIANRESFHRSGADFIRKTPDSVD